MVLAFRKTQQGASLIIAIFILVVLALLGAAMINILAGGSESVAREVISTRALFAAESGAQKKLNEIFQPGAAVSDPDQCAVASGVVGNTLYLSAQLAGLKGCGILSVSVDCSYLTVNDINYFTIRSTGSCGPANEQAVRIIEVQAKGV